MSRLTDVELAKWQTDLEWQDEPSAALEVKIARLLAELKAERERGAELRKFLARVADHTDAGCREFCVCNVEKWEPHADDCPIAKALKETE